MAMHESQSLFVEKQIGRSPAFWRMGAAGRRTSISARRSSLDDILPHVHKVERGLIRVDADEVTYPLHVILRFELEQDLVAGRLEVADIPEAWDAKMRDYLGLSTIDDAGRRADAGRALAGRHLRLFPVLHAGRHDGRAAMGGDRRGIPGDRERIRHGKFDAVNEWRRAKDLVARIALLDAGAAGAGDRRAAQRRPFHRASEEALRSVERCSSDFTFRLIAAQRSIGHCWPID